MWIFKIIPSEFWGGCDFGNPIAKNPIFRIIIPFFTERMANFAPKKIVLRAGRCVRTPRIPPGYAPAGCGEMVGIRKGEAGGLYPIRSSWIQLLILI